MGREVTKLAAPGILKGSRRTGGEEEEEEEAAAKTKDQDGKNKKTPQSRQCTGVERRKGKERRPVKARMIAKMSLHLIKAEKSGQGKKKHIKEAGENKPIITLSQQALKVSGKRERNNLLKEPVREASQAQLN
ncbi:MAG: hypothetical protein ACLR23_15520 [Clostridia bacterium]